MTTPLPFRYLAVTDQTVCPEPVPDRITRLNNIGVNGIQIRDKEQSDRSRYGWVEKIQDLECTKIFNGRVDVALLGSLDGVHLPWRGLDTSVVRDVGRPNMVYGRSTHTLEQLRTANNQNLDYVIFGPVFPTPSKPNLSSSDVHGLEGLHRATRLSDLPVLAIGGITPDRVKDCIRTGAYGVAGIRALMEPDSPETNWQTIKSTLENELQGANHE
jgi:thiamine-phosphate pyrophosphorylase